MSSISDNPLLQSWAHVPYELPPFETIKSSHFEAALINSMEDQLNNLKKIVEDPEPPTFENTIAKFDRSGELFEKVNGVFSNLCLSHADAELQKIELETAGIIANHYNKVSTYPGLFAKIDQIYSNLDSLNLNDEQKVLVQRFHLDFVRRGAKLSPDLQAQVAAIDTELAELSTKFSQNVTNDEATTFLEVTEADLTGLPADVISAAKQAAIDLKLSEKSYAITISRSLVVPFLTFSDRRDLREKAWKLWTNRGDLNDNNRNLPIAARILVLRAQKAKIFGYKNYGEYATADTMAGSPEKVSELLNEVWGRARLACIKEKEDLENYLATYFQDENDENKKFNTVLPWDWRYVAEKVRSTSYDLDTNEVKNYFSLTRMTEAIFSCANKLFGLEFIYNKDLKAYHPDVKIYEVKKNGEIIAIFIADNYARSGKRSGAWMSNFRGQTRNSSTGKPVIPIVINNNNFNKPGEGEECLLSFDDAVTLFHEFGHGLHGMLSNVTYSRLSGTNVLSDFVELPSQLYEHWLSEPVVLKEHARHFQTGEPISPELLDKLMKANKFHQGFQTVEFVSSALVDSKLHLIGEPSESMDLNEYESQVLAELQMPEGVIMRHRLPHFQHLFSGESYASAYYVYLWAEVLDADGFQAFTETGDCFNKEVAKRVYDYIYSAGGSKNPAELYRLFRGRDPIIEPMLADRGLLN